MTQQEIIRAIRQKNDRTSSPSLTHIYELQEHTNVHLLIDGETFDYIYKVKLDDIVNKDISEEIFTQYNWKQTDDGKYLFLYIES